MTGNPAPVRHPIPDCSEAMATQGVIFNIQKFSVHDGPGIRTTVFLKGCTLACKWCHNAEGRDFLIQPMQRTDLCIGCGACVKECPVGAISLVGGIAETDAGLCRRCGQCLSVCPQNGRELIGSEMTAAEVLAEVVKDRVFYEQSGGGVTFSGGEAMAQIDFLAELLAGAKSEGLHTAVDTAGHVPWEHFERILPTTDLFLYDLKLMDTGRHEEFTGAGNDQLLENLRRLSAATDAILIRIPVVPGVNDDDENIGRTLEFLADLRFEKVHLLPYHSLGQAKNARLAGSATFVPPVAPGEEELARLTARFTAAGVPAQVGG